MDKPVEHAARWPWVVAVAFLIVVAVIGTYASDRARGQKLAQVAAFNATSTSAVVVPPTTVAPAKPPGTKQQATPSASPTRTPTPATAGEPCAAQEFMSVVKRSGKVDETSTGPIAVERTKCVSGFAYARLTSDVGSVDAYFRTEGDGYRLLDLGTAIDPADYGVPTEIAAQLRS